jgi:tight adherence protein C
MNVVGAACGASFAFGILLMRNNLRTSFSLAREYWKHFANNDTETAARISVGSATLLATFVLAAVGKFSLIQTLAASVITTCGALVIQDNGWKNERRDKRLAISLTTPAWLDVCALCLQAGLPPRDALTQSLGGAAVEVQQAWGALSDAKDVPLVRALENVAFSEVDPVTSRVASSLLVSLERGTPVAEVLISLSSEIRSENRRALLEIAAKKDVTMMLPVVFGILPAVTVVALFPAFQTLTALN